MKTIEVKTNAPKIGFVIGFFGTLWWIFFGNGLKHNLLRETPFELFTSGKYEGVTQLDVSIAILISIVIAFIIGLFVGALFDFVAGTKTVPVVSNKDDKKPNGPHHKLTELNRLRDDGLITDKEYSAQKNKVMESI